MQEAVRDIFHVGQHTSAASAAGGCQPGMVVVCSHHAHPFVTVLSPHQSTQTICDTDSCYVALAAVSQTPITVLLGGQK